MYVVSNIVLCFLKSDDFKAAGMLRTASSNLNYSRLLRVSGWPSSGDSCKEKTNVQFP